MQVDPPPPVAMASIHPPLRVAKRKRLSRISPTMFDMQGTLFDFLDKQNLVEEACVGAAGGELMREQPTSNSCKVSPVRKAALVSRDSRLIKYLYFPASYSQGVV